MGLHEFTHRTGQLALAVTLPSLLLLVICIPTIIVAAPKTCGSLRNNTYIKIGNPLTNKNGFAQEPIVKLCYPNSIDGEPSEELEDALFPLGQPHYSASSHPALFSSWNDTDSGVFIVDKTRNQYRSQEVRHGLVLSMDSCRKYLPTQSVSLQSSTLGNFNLTREKPFALVHTPKSNCKCQNYLLTESAELQVESILWVVNGILVKTPVQGHYCLHPGNLKLTQNRIHVYSVMGVIEVESYLVSKKPKLYAPRTKACDGNGGPVPITAVYKVWTESNHPCGKSGHDLSSKSQGSRICLINPDFKGQLQLRPSCNLPSVTVTLRVVKNKTAGVKIPFKERVNKLPPTCGPVGREIDPALCQVKCGHNGLISLPGGCHMYGRCYFTRGDFVLYVIKCPPNHRFDPELKRCVVGTCFVQYQNPFTMLNLTNGIRPVGFGIHLPTYSIH